MNKKKDKVEKTKGKSSSKASGEIKIAEILKIGNIAKIKGKEQSDFYYVEGTSDEYLVILPNFCTCEQFVIKIINSPGQVCKHILAVQVAQNLKNPVEIDWMKLLLKHHE